MPARCSKCGGEIGMAFSTCTCQPKHTPGPWKTFCHPKSGRWEVLHGNHYICNCMMGAYYRDSVETAHNARLIAAAPELLEACQEAERWWQNQGNLPSAPWIHVVRDAIKKATGE